MGGWVFDGPACQHINLGTHYPGVPLYNWPEEVQQISLIKVNCTSGYDAISENLDGNGKEIAQPHPDSSRTIQDCAHICNDRDGCTSFEFASGNSETGACITYTGGLQNVRDDDSRLARDASWRSCVKSSSRESETASEKNQVLEVLMETPTTNIITAALAMLGFFAVISTIIKITCKNSEYRPVFQEQEL